MIHVQSQALAPDSPLHSHCAAGDFLDCYSVRSDAALHDAAETITRFPAWAQFLVAIRGILVAPFGLKASGTSDGPMIGPFPITQETENEIIAGFDDRHLDFRVSIRAENGRVSLATWVHPHNFGGRAYLATIMPFHILIARNALTRVAAG